MTATTRRKASARERLLDHFDSAGWSPPAGLGSNYDDAVAGFRRAARRLLRAHERELADVACVAASNAVNDEKGDRVLRVENRVHIAVRAAILGRAPRAGRKGR